jgi:hypothetical protein
MTMEPILVNKHFTFIQKLVVHNRKMLLLSLRFLHMGKGNLLQTLALLD